VPRVAYRFVPEGPAGRNSLNARCRTAGILGLTTARSWPIPSIAMPLLLAQLAGATLAGAVRDAQPDQPLAGVVVSLPDVNQMA